MSTVPPELRREVSPVSTQRPFAVTTSRGILRVGDMVRELPASHHIQPCDCCLCRQPLRPMTVEGFGLWGGEMYAIFDEGAYACLPEDLERLAR